MRVLLISKSQLVADPPGFEREPETTEKTDYAEPT